MDYISAFGTNCAALILAMGVSSTINSAAAQSSATNPAKTASAKASVKVNITGLRSNKGDVLICLSSNAKEFPDCSSDKKARKKQIKAVNGSSVTFKNVDPGVYALALVHDKNSNGEMDIALFLPKEGFGMSNNPKIRMGKPKFKNSKFTVGNANVVHNIKMNYIL